MTDRASAHALADQLERDSEYVAREMPLVALRMSEAAALLREARPMNEGEALTQERQYTQAELNEAILVALDRQRQNIDEGRISEPPTCATCRFCADNKDGGTGIYLGAHRTMCVHPLVADANKSAGAMVPVPFGCTLHDPLPAPPSSRPAGEQA